MTVNMTKPHRVSYVIIGMLVIAAGLFAPQVEGRLAWIVVILGGLTIASGGIGF